MRLSSTASASSPISTRSGRWPMSAEGSGGLHSVLEPAAAGIPTLFGPRHQNSRAAGELRQAGGARVVADGGAVVTELERWLADRRLLEEAGRRALEYIEGHRGASEHTARALVQHLPEAGES